jgi:hypothetical protein
MPPLLPARSEPNRPSRHASGFVVSSDAHRCDSRTFIGCISEPSYAAAS